MFLGTLLRRNYSRDISAASTVEIMHGIAL